MLELYRAIKSELIGEIIFYFGIELGFLSLKFSS